MKKILKIFILLFILVSLVGCQDEWQPNLITDINNLEGRKVGVNLSWEADYALTGRTDLELCRYDTTADLIMALSYNKVDAIAVDGLTWNMLKNCSTGLIKVDPEVKKTGYILYFAEEELKDEFNDYLIEFKKTEKYEDLIQRESNYEGEYFGPDIKLTGTGKTIKVAYEPLCYPKAFLNPGESVPTGFDLEALKYFANEENYQLDFTATSYDDGVMGLFDGKYDAMAGYLAEEYAATARYYGLFTSEAIDEMPIYFVQKTQEKITVDIEKLED